MRATTTAQQAALEGDAPKALLIKAELEAGTEYYAFAATDVEWDGQVWRAITLPVEVSEVREVDTGEAVGMQLRFRELDQSIIADALLNNIRFRPITVYLAAFEDDLTTIDSPIVVFKGFGDSISITMGSDRVDVAWAIETHEAMWNHVNGGRMTHAMQQARYPGDMTLRDVAEAASATELVWPSKEYWR